MPAELYWHIEGYVLFLSEYGSVQEADLQHSNHALLQVLDQLQPPNVPIHLVIDQREMEERSVNIKLLKERLTAYSHPAMGWVIVVSDDTPFWRFLSNAATQFTAAKLERVASIDNAISVLGSIDPRIEEILNTP